VRACACVCAYVCVCACRIFSVTIRTIFPTVKKKIKSEYWSVLAITYDKK